MILDVSEANAPAICYSLEILHLIITSKDHAWIIANITVLQACLDKWITSDIPMIAKALLPIMGTLFSVFVPLMPQPPDVVVFVKYIDLVIRGNLQNGVSAYATVLLMHSAYGLRKKNLDLGPLYGDISKLSMGLAEQESVASIEGLSMLLPLLKDRTMLMGGMC
jgi:hypothetical protein